MRILNSDGRPKVASRKESGDKSRFLYGNRPYTKDTRWGRDVEDPRWGKTRDIRWRPVSVSTIDPRDAGERALHRDGLHRCPECRHIDNKNPRYRPRCAKDSLAVEPAMWWRCANFSGKAEDREPAPESSAPAPGRR